MFSKHVLLKEAPSCGRFFASCGTVLLNMGSQSEQQMGLASCGWRKLAGRYYFLPDKQGLGICDRILASCRFLGVGVGEAEICSLSCILPCCRRRQLAVTNISRLLLSYNRS